jgi:hypothetical protein
MVTESIEGLTLDKLIKQQHYINLINKVKDVDGAIAHCKELNINISDLLLVEQKEKSLIAFVSLQIIMKALNEDWKPNWNDLNELKYWNYFNINNGTFSYSTYYDISYMSVPSALFFKSRELAEYAAKKFIELYKQLYLQT